MAQDNNAELLNNPKIKVLGIGGGGSNAVSRMFKDKLPVVEYFSVNTDAKHLFRCDVSHRLAIGQDLTRGLGSGANPDLGRQSAEESRIWIEEALVGADLVILIVGMGGGTGTGAAPVIAQIAKESGALTVAIVSKPFSFEASMRKKNADEGIARLKDNVDTLIVIDNDRLLQLNSQGDQTYTWEDALKMSDSVLGQGVKVITEAVTLPGEINIDFADIRTILNNAGPAWLAIGRGKGENRAVDAARQATKSPLMDISMHGARRVLFVIFGGPTLELQEVQDAARVLQDSSDPDASIIFGTCRDSTLGDEVKVIVIAASFPVPSKSQQLTDEEVDRLLNSIDPPFVDDVDRPLHFRHRNEGGNQGFFS